MMFDQSFPVIRGDFPISLPFESVIFVMEDVDVASPIVRSRERALYKRRKKQRAAAAKALKAEAKKAASAEVPENSKLEYDERRSEGVDVAAGSIVNPSTVSTTAIPSRLGEKHQQRDLFVGAARSAGVEGGSGGDGDGNGEVWRGGRPTRVSVDGDNLGTNAIRPAAQSCSPSSVAPSEQVGEYAASESTGSFEKVLDGETQEDEKEVEGEKRRVHDNDCSLERGRNIGVDSVGAQGEVGKVGTGVGSGVATTDPGAKVNPASVTADPAAVAGKEIPAPSALVGGSLVTTQANREREGAYAAVMMAAGKNPAEDSDSDSSYYESSDSESDISDNEQRKSDRKRYQRENKKSGRSGRKKYASKSDKLDLAVSCGSMLPCRHNIASRIAYFVG